MRFLWHPLFFWQFQGLISGNGWQIRPWIVTLVGVFLLVYVDWGKMIQKLKGGEDRKEEKKEIA
ncbi:MAG: hypothetical protein ACOC44_15110 [Promethearchaeia archaeon]